MYFFYKNPPFFFGGKGTNGSFCLTGGGGALKFGGGGGGLYDGGGGILRVEDEVDPNEGLGDVRAGRGGLSLLFFGMSDGELRSWGVGGKPRERMEDDFTGKLGLLPFTFKLSFLVVFETEDFTGSRGLSSFSFETSFDGCFDNAGGGGRLGGRVGVFDMCGGF